VSDLDFKHLAISHSGQLALPGMPSAFPFPAAADRWPSIRRAGDAGWPCVCWRRWLPSSTG